MTFMLTLAALNLLFTLSNLLMGANRLAAFTALNAVFCAGSAALMS